MVDARPAAEYRLGHLSGAVNLPYDWLSGEHLGREISGRGIKNVCFITGGAPAVLPEAHR